MRPFEYRTPADLEEVHALLERYGEEARLIAGGTALVLMMRQRLLVPACLISLRGLAGLQKAEVLDGGVRLGGGLTHRAVEISPLIRERFPLLTETYHQVATIRVRNMATVGGGLAHADPNQDPPTVLMALGAKVCLSAASGERELLLEEFFLDYYETALRPGEVITGVVVPQLPPHSGGAYLKFLPRTADDYATVGVAAVVALDPESGRCLQCRIAMGCVGPTTLRARGAEALLQGQTLTPELLQEAGVAAGRDTDPLSDFRGSAAYKRAMAEVFVRRALQQARDRARGEP